MDFLLDLPKPTEKNPIDSGLIKLNTPMLQDPFMNKSAILGQHKEQSFYNYSAGFPKSGQNWVEFDFRSQRVLLSAYLIRASNRYIMKSWDIVGSNDRTKWELIHSVRDADMTKEKHEQVFRCQTQKGPFQYVRYVQLANCERDQKCQYFIQISAIEFFASLVPALQLAHEQSQPRRDR
jgi:hypothetical protein